MGPRREDLTAKARIRNAALALYADAGEDGTSMRRIADEAGVTVGLVVHHYGTKDRLREAIEEYVVQTLAETIDAAPRSTAARDDAVADLLASAPAIRGYVRRSILGTERNQLLARLTNLGAQQINSPEPTWPAPGVDIEASTRVVQLMVRAFGRILLQPVVDDMWDHLEGTDGPTEQRPTLVVRIAEAGAPAPG
ncbi:MAG: helix-turn-helix transcriptional regulator [Rhodococcus sp.]|nr:helix-turn-helix transcriptional regulator [Rhodococcus sp. (in: high G+C Gram-positive bacteria)]